MTTHVKCCQPKKQIELYYPVFVGGWSHWYPLSKMYWNLRLPEEKQMFSINIITKCFGAASNSYQLMAETLLKSSSQIQVKDQAWITGRLAMLTPFFTESFSRSPVLANDTIINLIKQVRNLSIILSHFLLLADCAKQCWLCF